MLLPDLGRLDPARWRRDTGLGSNVLLGRGYPPSFQLAGGWALINPPQWLARGRITVTLLADRFPSPAFPGPSYCKSGRFSVSYRIAVMIGYLCCSLAGLEAPRCRAMANSGEAAGRGLGRSYRWLRRDRRDPLEIRRVGPSPQ